MIRVRLSDPIGRGTRFKGGVLVVRIHREAPWKVGRAVDCERLLTVRVERPLGFESRTFLRVAGGDYGLL